MIECSKSEWGRQAARVATTDRFWVRGGLVPGRHRQVVIGAAAVLVTRIPRTLAISSEPSVIKAQQIDSNRHYSRVEHAVTHSKQRIGASSTRHKIGGAF